MGCILQVEFFLPCHWFLAQGEDTRPVVWCILYVGGLSEDIRRVCRWFGVRTIYKSGPTLRSHLVKVKDKVPTLMKSNVVYHVPGSCGKVYIRKKIRRSETRMTKHEDGWMKGMMEKSVIFEHAWTTNHNIELSETTVLDKTRWRKADYTSAWYLRFSAPTGMEVWSCQLTREPHSKVLQYLHQNYHWDHRGRHFRSWMYAILKLRVWLLPYTCVVFVTQ